MALEAAAVTRLAARPAPPFEAARAAEAGRAEVPVYYLVPRHWVLADVMTPAEWQQLRERVRRATAAGARCTCPGHCPATVLEEQWDYDASTHTKRFVAARLLCAGCHWLNSWAWRVETWHELRHHPHRHRPTKTHLVDCLGWTRRQVSTLRDRDLADQAARMDDLLRIETAAQRGEAAVRPWDVDLRGLHQYGYSDAAIDDLAARMQARARERVR